MRHIHQLKPLLIASALTGLILSTGCEQSKDIAQQEKNSTTPAISVNEKKANFFAYLQPMIEQANSDVLTQRQQLLDFESKPEQLKQGDHKILAALIKTYRVDDKLNISEQIEQLKTKVNTIPAALILAQAANESAWGTSRFAREGNNFFGQWCFSKVCGIVPNSRNSGANHEVASFESPLDSVKSYIRNLNSHPAYALLRTLRQQSIKQGQSPSGETLAQGLIGYSERGEEYVKEIQSMIRYNKLSRFDNTHIENTSIDKAASSSTGKG
jgi:Bax protein